MNTHIQKINFASTKNAGSQFLDLTRRFSFFPRNLQIPESHENPKNQIAPKMDSGMFAVFLKTDSSRKIIAEGADESIRTQKTHVFTSKFKFFIRTPGEFHFRDPDLTWCNPKSDLPKHRFVRILMKTNTEFRNEDMTNFTPHALVGSLGIAFSRRSF